MIILGLNAFHGDSAAALVIDGKVVSAVEEERFKRIKHWAGFPSDSIRWCLEDSKLKLTDVDIVAINQDSGANFQRRLFYLLQHWPSPGLILDKLRTRGQRMSLVDHLQAHFPNEAFRGQVAAIEHHQAHLASAFFPSPFQDAWTLSVDGFGDFASAAWGFGDASGVQVEDRVLFPHSLGAFYQAFTQYLGFPNYGDEYKVMGLAPYGEPVYLDALRDIVQLQPNGGFKLNLPYFRHHKDNVMFEWDGGSPVIGTMFSAELEAKFGPARQPDDALNDAHWNMASSVQAMYEEAFFHLLNTLYDQCPAENVAIAGGCGMNSVANGKIKRRTRFQRVFVQAAAGDAGGAIGAALAEWHRREGAGVKHQMHHAYLGPAFSQSSISELINTALEARNDISITSETDQDRLCRQVAAEIAEGKVVGWFQGAMEWGPRALGHRSILGDPRRADMKDILNLKIKRRESFRPFAPSILREAVGDWFEEDDDVPFMMKVFQIRAEKRSEIPAVTHVDGSGRLQTVTEADNGLYYRLIRAFGEQTGVPIVLNTSFNENEPIVCRPEEALDCFLRTKMDVLVMENIIIRRL